MASRWRNTRSWLLIPALIALVPAATAAQAHRAQQFAPGEHRSSNMKLIGHLPLPGERFSHADLEMEQEASRPFVYIGRRKSEPGFDIISIADPAKPKVIYQYTVKDAALHRGSGGVAGHYAKVNGRYYFIESYEFSQGGINSDLGAQVFDVTGLPDPKLVKLVAEIRFPDMPGGIHEVFTYKHSDGRVILATTTVSENGHLYDLGKLVRTGDVPGALLGKFPVPITSPNRKRGWHDLYLGYDPATKQDKLYGAGMGGYYVFDVTTPESPALLFSLTGIDGTPAGHTLSPTPDGKFMLGISEPTYQYAPVRSFDLRPALEGKTKNINRAIGAWIAKWNGASHYHEMRWPYVFISAQDDGLQVVNYMDPTNPHTVAYYSTREGPELGGESPSGMGYNGGGIYDGAWAVDVRNSDGLIAVSDFNSGLWIMKMEGFDGWNGHDWGMPNISGAQDYDRGPDGAQRPVPKPVT
jgi:hypothetical protein